MKGEAQCLNIMDFKTCFEMDIEPEEYCDICKEDYELNEAEQAYENMLSDYYGSSQPVTLKEKIARSKQHEQN